MTVCHADLMRRLADAEAHVAELRSRVLGLTALNAELTRKLAAGVDETSALAALQARNEELQGQLDAAHKEVSGLQARRCYPAHVLLLGCSPILWPSPVPGQVVPGHAHRHTRLSPLSCFVCICD